MVTQKKDLCEFCEGKVEYHLIQAMFHFKGQTIYVDNVPAWVCKRCGEQYFDAPVYKRLEEIARRRSRIKKTVRFPLAEYNMILS
ncbi:MAG TPA: type II toxin-antitoxin system MqsA family antitoxin [Candidatus Brocadiia bacterium]|nr:type II toxin-antitoxin system MqsA family antitoxin [Planctomycetota bacterium]MDO8093001.1 type II toxin-antitoxin system MqsA family antitoxin [Candidatus Brocadiales bacterium]